MSDKDFFSDVFDDVFKGLDGGTSKGFDPKNPTAGLTMEKKVELQHQMVVKLGTEVKAARQKTSEVVQAYNALKAKHIELVRAHNSLLTRVEALERVMPSPN